MRGGGVLRSPVCGFIAASTAAPFVSTDFFGANLIHCYDPGGANFVDPGDGNALPTWHDEVGTDNPTNTTGTKQLVYRASVANLNNRPALQGDGIDDVLQVTLAAAIPLPFSIITVVDVVSLGAVDVAVCHGDNTHKNRSVGSNTLSKWAIHNGGTAAVSGTAVAVGGHLTATEFISGTDVLEVDGTVEISSDTGSDTCDRIALGANAQNTRYYCDWRIALVMVLDTPARAHADWAAFEAAANTHFGL